MMMMPMMLMVLIGGSGGNDLVDYIDTNTYWSLQSVEVTVPAMKEQLVELNAKAAASLAQDLIGDDEAKAIAAANKIKLIGMAAMPHLEKAAKDAQGKPDNAARVQNLIGELYENLQGPDVRRLMAIRTLGELKKTDAVAILKPLLKSKKLFEAEYAAAAIAAINGKVFKRPSLTKKERMKDVYLLPAGCGVVGQTMMTQGKPVDLAKAIKAMGNMGGQDPQEMLKQLTSMLTKAAGYVGNVRIDAVTLGLADNVGNDTGFAVIIARGRYNTKALREMFLQIGRAKTETIDKVEVFKPERNVAIFMPSSDRLVMITGPNGEQIPVAQMIAAVKAGKGALTADSDIGKIIKGVDTSSPIWAAARMSETYRQVSVLAPFDTITLTSKIVKDTHSFKITATGLDAENVAQAVKEFDGYIAEGRQELTQQAKRMPMFKPLADLLKSVKTSTDGTKATLTASFKGASPVMSIFSMFLGAMPSAPDERRIVEKAQMDAAKPVPAP
ncbi:MAG: hypothetical protein GY794_00815 [bacterium]|nr:hypothetical protein [bacterium]